MKKTIFAVAKNIRMSKNLVIVESPAKAKTIEKFLGKDYHVLSCFGHIRDLPKNNISIDTAHDFQHEYIVQPEKKALISQLSKAAKAADYVWLASDEDREGEAIAWHLDQVLKLLGMRYAVLSLRMMFRGSGAGCICPHGRCRRFGRSFP